MIITGMAFVVNSAITLSIKTKGHDIAFSREGFWLLIVAGVAASGVDIFGLLAYERGLRVASSLIISGVSVHQMQRRSRNRAWQMTAAVSWTRSL
jgi:hypothetical protein